MKAPEIPIVDGLLRFDCPRCHGPAAERAYGPCEQCTAELRAGLGRDPSGAPVPERSRFEPKMNVVPNHVATKE